MITNDFKGHRNRNNKRWQSSFFEEIFAVDIFECAKFRGSRPILSLVGLTPSIHGAFVCSEFFLVGILWVWNFFSWLLRGSQSFSRGYLSVPKIFSWVLRGSKIFPVSTSWVRIIFSWVRRGSKGFFREYYLVLNFFLVRILLVSFVLKPRIVSAFFSGRFLYYFVCIISALRFWLNPTLLISHPAFKR